MKIIIAGAGNVGKRLIEDLAEEGHNIVLVDRDSSVVETIIDTCDIMGIVGNCVSADILKNAGASEADLVIACTQQDEMNILCCMVAKKLGVKETIARVRNPEYFDLFHNVDLGLTMMVNPEKEAALEINRVLRFPSAIKIEPFADGKVELVEIKIHPDSPLANQVLKDITHRFQIKIVVCAVHRGKEIFIPNGDFVLQAWDEIYFTSAPKDITQLFREMGLPKAIRKVMIAGGSRTAFYLAKELRKSNITVKIIENDESRCKLLEEELDKADIVFGDAANQDILIDEGLQSMDAFVSLCGIDERNIILSLFASKQGIQKVVTKVDNVGYLNLLEHKGSESIVSIASSTANQIVRYVRGKSNSISNEFRKLYRIIDDSVEVMEYKVSEDFSGINIPIKDLRLQPEVLIAAIVRNGDVIIPGGNDSILQNDTLVLVTTQDSFGNLNDMLE